MRNSVLRRRNPGGRDYVCDGHRSQDGMRKYIKSNVDMAKNICKSWVRLYQHRRSRWNRLHHCSVQWSAENGPYHQYFRIILKTRQKEFAQKNQNILKKLSNNASVFNNCQFTFSFGPEVHVSGIRCMCDGLFKKF